MKTLNIMRGYAGLQALLPSVGRNVQEVTPVNGVTIAISKDDADAYRPRLLAQRNVRHARRAAH